LRDIINKSKQSSEYDRNGDDEVQLPPPRWNQPGDENYRSAPPAAPPSFLKR
jgi:hypothetical protein